MKFGELTEALQNFLASVKKFYTQKVNFEREKAPVTLSTYEKVQDRMLCKYLLFFFSLILITAIWVMGEVYLTTPPSSYSLKAF